MIIASLVVSNRSKILKESKSQLDGTREIYGVVVSNTSKILKESKSQPRHYAEVHRKSCFQYVKATKKSNQLPHLQQPLNCHALNEKMWQIICYISAHLQPVFD